MPHTTTANAQGGTPIDNVTEKAPLTDRRTNLALDSQKKNGGMLIRIFVAACHHDVVMAKSDMDRKWKCVEES